MGKIRLRIAKNKVIELERLLGVFLLVIPFLHLWYFYGYYAKLCVVGFTLAVFLLIKVVDCKCWNKAPMVNTIFLFYMTIHMLLINFPSSFTYYIIIITGYLIAQLKISKQTIDMMQSIMIVVGLFYAVTMIWQWALEGSFNTVLRLFVIDSVFQQAIESVMFTGDYTGFACESNRACICIVPAASILFSRLFFKNKGHYWQTLLLFCVTYFSIILSGRRAFILSFPAVLVVITLCLLFRKRSTSAKILAISSVFIAIFVFNYFLFDKVIDLLTRGSGTTIALSNREVYWDLALKLYRENPIFGAGMRSYDYFYNIMSGRDIVFAGAHNSYLEMLAEIGIIGTVLFILVIIYVIVKSAARAVYCIRCNNKEFGQILMSSLLIECILVLVGLSEAVFFAPFSLILFFVCSSISFNAISLTTVE